MYRIGHALMQERPSEALGYSLVLIRPPTY